MNQLKMKAKAGVTLVELLVVILIVTILSVSMLPLLQPFVTEAQYAAEAIPVIGNLRTKIGLYQYDKGKLPNDDKAAEYVHTWMANPSDSESFIPAVYTYGGSVGAVQNASNTVGIAEHIGTLVDVDYQDLKGKRSKPLHYQYYAISSTNNFAYVIACFGDGNGLKAGTGYAVCELNYTKAGKKYIGTWKRYKPVNDEAGALKFGSTPPNAGEKVDYCYVPAANDFKPTDNSALNGEPSEVSSMKEAGWEF